METPSIDYDEKIMNSIKYSFKTCKEISQETGLDYNIVSRRLRQFRRDNLVFFQETQSKKVVQGIKPMKYKLKNI